MTNDDAQLSIAGKLSFFFCTLAVMAAPWFFAAWEAWWFWPFAFLLFCGFLCFSLRLLGCIRRGERLLDGDARLAGLALAGFVPFLVYALIRTAQATVYIDAERTFLLFLTPVLLGVQIVFGFHRGQLRLLYVLLLANLLLLGLYGAVNDCLTDSRLVFWRPAYETYEGRASGTYFCPDHFSGIMELAFCLGLGVILSRDVRWFRKLLVCSLLFVALWGIYVSRSRGGGLTVLVVLAATLVWGFAQWPWGVQWAFRLGLVALAALALSALVATGGGGYLDRFRDYPWRDWRKMNRVVFTASALRAWQVSPWVGIGPGMHQHLWPAFSATPDGSRKKGRWPSIPNIGGAYLYEAHNDWAQLLEEHGVAGLGLFLMAAFYTLSVLFVGYYRELTDRVRNRWGRTGRKYHALVLGAILACVAMAFHSLGDFNLQMPATVWIMACIVALPIAFVVREPAVPHSRRPHGNSMPEAWTLPPRTLPAAPAGSAWPKPNGDGAATGEAGRPSEGRG